MAGWLIVGAAPATAGIADPDPTFGGDGVADVSFGDLGELDSADSQAVAIAPDGRLVVVGSLCRQCNTIKDISYTEDSAVARLNDDGSPDLGFSDDGQVLLDTNPGQGWHGEPRHESATDVVVRDDGRIVVAIHNYTFAPHPNGEGGWEYRDEEALRVAQLLPSGVPDQDFGDDGVATIELPDGVSWSPRIALDADGNVIIAGYVPGEQQGAATDVYLARLTEAGLLDPEFSEDGSLTLDTEPGAWDRAEGVAVLPDGTIRVVGYSYGGETGETRRSLVADVDPSGALEEIVLGPAPLYDIVARPDGSTIAVGAQSSSGEEKNVAFAELRGADGITESWSYAAHGANGTLQTSAKAVALLPDGRAVASGWAGDDCSVFLIDPGHGHGFVGHASLPFCANDLATDGGGRTVALGDGLLARFLAPTEPEPEPTVPQTRIVNGPKGSVGKRSVAFHFRASVEGASFRCKLDRRSWRACKSPERTKHLEEGRHRFQVRAVRDGKLDPTPATRRFRVR